MSVTLDNIQFYHGPSKPRTQPYFAFDSKRNTSGTPLSARPPEFANDSTLSAIDHCEPLSSILHPDNIIGQETLQPPNIFDIEMSRMWETVPTSEDSYESGASFAQTLGCHLQELSSKGTSGISASRALRETIEFDSSGLVPRSHSFCNRPSSSPALKITESSSPRIVDSSSISSFALEDTQQQEDHRPRATAESSSPANIEEISNISSTFREHFSSHPFSCTSSCQGPASRATNGRSLSFPLPDDNPGGRQVGHTGLESDSCPTSVAVADSPRPANTLHVNTPDLTNVEQATNCGHDISQSRAASGIPPIRRKRREYKQPSTSRQYTAPEDRRMSVAVAVVIPPPRPHHLRGMRSSAKPVLSDADHSDNSKSFDDTSDEVFTNESIESEFSEFEDHQGSVEADDHSNMAASCHANDMSLNSSTSHRGCKDIMGRAILTMETLGLEPTYFFTFMPDNIRSMPYKPVQSSPRDSERPARIGKIQVSRGSSHDKRKRRPYSTDEDRLLVKLKEEKKLAWGGRSRVTFLVANHSLQYVNEAYQE
ncbi:hypothetical protein N7481_006505 [Penicillium waksmanii]|uniref:uncharacterized protein n=1 Tax=Penicillium waksmanii TaxID=69791 RepID=UPI002547A7B2|nr:uncharacterized protein N7481_006505 [Penicillium waksmanii]KAJ5984406.1 hypothetical protein N7481_006505 [Penicillium waksmanii]